MKKLMALVMVVGVGAVFAGCQKVVETPAATEQAAPEAAAPAPAEAAPAEGTTTQSN